MDAGVVKLPGQLRAAITLRATKGISEYLLRQITGWSQGIAVYRWLNSTHLLLYPITEKLERASKVMPVVMNLNTGKAWLPVLDNSPYNYGWILWTESLQALVTTQSQGVLFYNPDGIILRRYPSEEYAHLAPSGQRLLTRYGWRDLKTGKAVMFKEQAKWAMWSSIWSADETRLFGYCADHNFAYADAGSGKYRCFEPGGLRLPAGEGPMPVSRWVLGDTRVMIEMGLDDIVQHQSGLVALIDPVGQSYVDVRTLAGLDPNLPCYTSHIAPDGRHLWVGCTEESTFKRSFYLIDLRTIFTQTVPGDWEFCTWSADSQFALLARDIAFCDFYFKTPLDYGNSLDGDFALIRVADGDLYALSQTPVSGPSWDPSGKRLAFLTGEGRTLFVLDVTTRATAQVPLVRSSVGVLWSPQGDKLAVLADDGSLWWTRNLATGDVRQLTPPVPKTINDVLSIWNVRWSPDGTQLAFVSGTDVYVVSVTRSLK